MKHMKNYTILTPDAAAALINSNDEFRGAVRKTLSTQIVYSLDSILRGAWYDPSIETLVRITDSAASVLAVGRSKLEGAESIIVPMEVAGWRKENHDTFYAVAHYDDCSRGALYHYEKTGRDTLSYSITAGVSDFIRDQEKIRAKQEGL